ncbi:hypothetical protein QZH41_018785 [Actinostola sp. cb2023]|nr:hypothetical protein QZH41_018785 [Actinostola sp. cb2023]
MNTFLSRLNTIFAFTLTVLAALTFCCFLSTVFLDYHVKVTLKSINPEVKNVQDFSVSTTRNDLGVLSFDKFNQVVLWDKIIRRDDKKLRFTYYGMNTKYYFFDDGHGLRGLKNVSMHLSWNVIPTAGLLPLVSGEEHKHLFDFPGTYTPYQR